MTRFLYLADSHWGAGDRGYHLQPKYDERLPELLTALRGWLDEHGPVDFLLHGGDVVHETSDAGIAEAVRLFDLGLPVHLGLGNHDLTAEASVDTWRRLAPAWLGPEGPDYAVTAADAVIHVAPNQYGVTPYRWETTQDPHFLPAQVERLERRLAASRGPVQLLLTHSPVVAVSPEQTGRPEPFHGPPAAFTGAVGDLARRHGIACVLGAHSHANSHAVRDGVRYVTVSSFVETPFEFKEFRVDGGAVSMWTHNLWDRVGFAAAYDWDSTWVQGRAADRGFTNAP